MGITRLDGGLRGRIGILRSDGDFAVGLGITRPDGGLRGWMGDYAVGWGITRSDWGLRGRMGDYAFGWGITRLDGGSRDGMGDYAFGWGLRGWMGDFAIGLGINRRGRPFFPVAPCRRFPPAVMQTFFFGRPVPQISTSSDADLFFRSPRAADFHQQ
jgi:hypothetical protein